MHRRLANCQAMMDNVRARRKGRRAADSAGSLAKVNNGGETEKILRRGLQAQGNSWEQNKKDRSFVVFLLCWEAILLEAVCTWRWKKRKDATVSTVERASFAVLPVTWTTLIWLVKKKRTTLTAEISTMWEKLLLFFKPMDLTVCVGGAFWELLLKQTVCFRRSNQ